MAAPPVEPPVDIAHARASDARAHYAPAETRALGVMALAAVAALVWVALPVAVGILLGALLAFTVYRPYRRLVRKTRRPRLAAFAATTATTIVVTGALGSLVYLLVLQGLSIFGALPQSFAPGGPAGRVVERLAGPLSLIRLQPSDIADKLRDAAGAIASSLAGWAAQLLQIVVDGALALLFVAMTMYVVLVHWSTVERHAERMLPINPRHTRRLMRELSRLGRQTVIGNMGTALIQGVIAGFGYLLAGVPNPAFLGAITAIAALVPAFGTLLVWVPAGLVLLFERHVGAGIFELAWGTVAVVGVCDYVVRPKLVGRGEVSSTWLMFVALFGGVKLFGFVGFLLGPLIVGIAVSALRLYERTRRFRLSLS